MRTATLGILLILVAAAAWTVGRSSARPAAPEASPFDLTGSIEDIMIGMVEPSADTIFESVAVVSSAAGITERVPKTDADWASVEHAALTLAEAANLLRMPGRKVARGTGVGAPAVEAVPELPPEQIQQKIEADRAQWTQHTEALIEQARRALEHARARNVQGLFDVGGRIDEACESCHLVYWYPNAPRPPEERR